MRTLRVFLHYNCETLMLAKQAINDKLQGKVEKLIAQTVSEFFKSVNIWQCYNSVVVSRTLHA